MPLHAGPADARLSGFPARAGTGTAGARPAGPNHAPARFARPRLQSIRMSLPPPAPRRHLHTRRIVCEGFRRDDGLWDIEGRIVDTKTYAYEEPDRGLREPGASVHDMAVRLTLDDRMVVQAIEVDMAATPYRHCLTAEPAFQGLIGKQVGLGWRRAVNECVGGTRGCTHVRELLFPMATVAFQTMGGWKEQSHQGDDLDGVPSGNGGRPYFIDGCKSWAADGPVVARLHPQFAVRRVTET